VKVLFLITGLRLGGAEHQLLILARNLYKEGVDVIVVSMETGGVMKGKFEGAGIAVHELAIKTFRSLKPGYTRFRNLVKEFKPDIIHSHMIHANLFARVFKLLNRKHKLVNTAHNIREGSDTMMRAYGLTKWLPNWSTNVSLEAYDSFIKNGYFDVKKSGYLPNAIDTERYRCDAYTRGLLHTELELDPEAFIYFSAGRLEPQKNYAMLLQSFALVRRQIDNVHLVIAGEGQEETFLKKLIADIEINASVSLLGRRADMPSLLNGSDCFVLTSNYEGFGMAVAEAMAMGKHVVATDCGGVKEVMGGFGELVKVNDYKAFSEAMIRAYQFPSAAAALEAARKHIELNYSIRGVINKWLALYNRL
jgi:glycosyltransferase involved in cell wall biosynthesis